MAVRSCSVSPLRWGSTALRRTDAGIEATIPAAGDDGAVEWEAIMKKQPPTRRSRSNSPPPPPREHASRLRARTVMRHRAVIPSTPTPTCTPTPTPTVTPSQTPPSTTPVPTPPRKNGRPEGSRGKLSSVSSSVSSSGSSITFPPARLQTPWGVGTRPRGETATEGFRVDASLPPVPAFSSSFTPPRAAPASAVRTAVTATAAAAAGASGEGAWKKGETRQPPRESDEHRAGPFAGQGMPFSAGTGVGGETGQRAPPAAVCERTGGGIGGTEPRQSDDGEGVVQQDACSASDRVAASVASEVAGMLDESRGTHKLSRDGLGDERVTDLSLEGLKDAYRTGRASLTSWTTAGVFDGGRKPSTDTSLVEVEQGRLGVLSSTDAYLFHFKETKPSSPRGSTPVHSFDVSQDADQAHIEVHVVYLWVGREAGTEALLAARAQGKRLLQQQSPLASCTPLLEVEQGCEPALFLALFSYMLPPLVAVVLQGRNEMPKLRVLELQESPCLGGSGIVIAVEGPSSASLLAKHGPLPDRSYICLVRPRRSRGGSASERGGTFDEGYYWHGVGETPAVEEVGILLCQQVDRMFPSPSITECGKRKGCGRKRRGGGGGGFGGGMMRGYVADVKVGLPVPDGFWACVLPERSVSSSFFASGGRWLPLQDLRPVQRSRPVRVFGVCAGSQNARKSFVWEVTTGGMPSQMRLSPSLSHVVDAGGSHVYVWHGNGSSSDGRRLACRVASSYVVGCGASVEEVDAGSEPVGLLDCFIGWNEALVEPPPMLSLSPGRRPSQLGTNVDLSPRTTPTKTARRGRRSPTARTASSGSTSSSMGPRLTPPGQRTPPFSVNSPPSLKQPAGGACTPPRRRAPPTVPAAHPAAAEVSSLSSQGYSTPPRNSRPVAQDSVPQCGGPSDSVHGVFASPPLCSGSTPCSGTSTSTPDRATGPRGPPGEVSPTAGAGGSASDARGRPGDELPSSSSSLSSPGVHPCTETASGGKALAGFDRERGGGYVVGFPNGECSTGAGIQCAGVQDECSAGNDETKGGRSPGGAGCGDESGGNSGGDSDRGGDDDNDNSGGRDGSGGGDGGAGGGGGGDDGDGHRFRGAQNSGESDAVNKEKQEEAQHRDRDESEESDADEEGDTFLRLSDVQFCEGVGITRNAGASADSSWACSEAPDALVTGRRSGSGVETCGVLSRHLSDFFRSPFSLDSASNQQLSSIRSSSDVPTRARLVDSVRTGGPDDSGSSRTGGSGSLSGFNEASVDASSGAISDADDVPCRGMINYAASPRYSAPSPADVANSLSDLVGPLPLLGTVENDDELVAKSSDCSAPAAGPADLGPAVSQESRTSTAPADYDPGTIEDAKGGRQAADLEDGGDGSESIEGDGGGAESEEEWLSHSLGDAASVPGSAQRSEGSEGASMFQEENPLNPNHDCCASHSGNSEPFSSTPVSTKEQGEKQTEEDPAAEVESSWAGLNEDGSWKTEYARRAAGDAGAAEAERRRLAKVKADESWRSDGRKCGGTGCHGAQGVRRESRSFTRLTGNVRDKLSVFEGAPSAKAAKETTGNRSSLGALHGRGLVSAWAKKSANYASPPVATRKDCGSPSHIWSDGARRASRLTDSRSRGRSDQAEMDDVDEQDGEFLWKAGPAPCRLKGRPSLNLIRNGQVRIMSKALLMSCPESGDDHVFGRIDEKIGATPKATHAGGSSGASSSEPPAPSRSPSQQPLPPPPRVPISPPLTQTSPVDAGANRCPHPEHGSPDGSGFEQRPAVPRGNFWLAKAGLTRKGAGGGCATPAPATTSRSGDAWRKAGDTFTSPVTCAMGRVAAGVATAARVNDATHGSREEGHGRPLASVRSWANLRRRLGEERKSMGGEETASPGVSSG